MTENEIEDLKTKLKSKKNILKMLAERGSEIFLNLQFRNSCCEPWNDDDKAEIFEFLQHFTIMNEELERREKQRDEINDKHFL